MALEFTNSNGEVEVADEGMPIEEEGDISILRADELNCFANMFLLALRECKSPPRFLFTELCDHVDRQRCSLQVHWKIRKEVEYKILCLDYKRINETLLWMKPNFYEQFTCG